MKTKLSKKIKVIIIAGGVLLLGTAALVAGIVVAGQAEENKIVKTAYAGEVSQMNENEVPASTEISTSSDSLSITEIDDELSKEEAKASFSLVFEMFFNHKLETRHFEASLDTKSNVWIIGNKEAIGYVDAQTGEVLAFYNLHGYIGKRILTVEEYEIMAEDLKKNHYKYIVAATQFIERNLAQDRYISEVFLGSVEFIGDTDQKGTFLVTIRILMDSGNSYCIGFTEDYSNLERFFSYPTQEECVAGSVWEDGPPPFPSDWEHSVLNSEPTYVPQVVYNADIGEENITIEHAMNTMIEHMKILYDEDIDRETLSANFSREGNSVKYDTWWIYNSDFSCGVDAITGNILGSDDRRSYFGADDFSEGEIWRQTDKIIEDDSIYTELASNVVTETLADGRKIEYLMVDGIQAVFNDYNQEQTVLVDVKVLMETGRSYTLSFIGSERHLYRFMSHPSQEGAVYGYFWEEEASEYPSDWQSGESGHA